MQYLNRFNPIRLRASTRYLEQALTDNNETALERKEIVDFFAKYGLQATIDAYKISKSTLYNWKRQHKDNGIRGLIPLPKTPLNKRQGKIHPLVKEFIKNYRNKYPKTGQKVIKPLLDVYCKDNGIKTISAGSIALIIKQLKNNNELKEYNRVKYNGKTGKVHMVKPKKKLKKQRRKEYKPENPGDLIQLDTITRFSDGLKTT